MTTISISTDGHKLAKRLKCLLQKGEALHKLLKPGEKAPMSLGDCLAWGTKQFLSGEIEAVRCAACICRRRRGCQGCDLAA